jgi:tRNA-specific 2-thiouridylase
VPDNDYRAFLRNKVQDLDERIGPGNFMLSNGTIAGQHLGYPYYTIGQRKGLGIAFGLPMFVTRILPESNTIMLGTIDELERSEALVRNINLVKYDSITEPLDAITKIRYKDSGAMSTLTQLGDTIKVDFHHSVSGIAPGQSAVFYEGSDLLGGGFLV